MNRVRAPFNVGNLGQAAAIAALDDAEHVAAEPRAEQRRARAGQRAASAHSAFRVAPSQANFVLVDVKKNGRANLRRACCERA